jgi:Bacterial regulatory helix-turn-helix protein, lysR family
MGLPKSATVAMIGRVLMSPPPVLSFMQQPNSGKNVDSSSFTRYHWYLMDTRFLESFIAVVDNGSIAEAARRLDLTPAAVAKRICALEHQIGAAWSRAPAGWFVRPKRA